MNFLISELKKSKRTVNTKMIWIAPILFTLFSFLASLLMMPIENKSTLIAGAYNWFPLIILPLIISLLVVNSINIEKKNKNSDFLKSKNVAIEKVIISKNIVVSLILFCIIMISFILIYILSTLFDPNTVDFIKLLKANISLFICCLPLVSLSYIIIQLTNTFLVLSVNFIFGLLASIVSLTSFWTLYPWSYSFRAMAPLLELHPNGTFLEGNNPLLDINNLSISILSSIIFYLLATIMMILTSKKVFK